MKKINLAVYDFDGTLVPFETQSKILSFAIKKNPSKILFLPYVLICFVLYLLKIVNETYMKSLVLKFLNKKLIKEFWQTHEKYLFNWVKTKFAQDKKDGKEVFVISASPENVLKDFVMRIGADYFIGTPVSKDGKRIIGKNCKGVQKIVYLNKWAEENHLDTVIESMYSDSKNDLPLMRLAKISFWVDTSGNLKKFNK